MRKRVRSNVCTANLLEISGGSPYTSGVARRPAVFIDRDGTLTEEVGYVNHPSRLRLLPRSAAAVRRLNEAGIAAVVATNQAVIARGYFSEDLMHAVHERLVNALKEAGAHLDGLYVCPHHPTDGARAVLVLTGYGQGEWEYRREHFSVASDHVAADLLDAVDWVIARRRDR